MTKNISFCTGYALKCQVCGEGSGICQSADDNGVYSPKNVHQKLKLVGMDNGYGSKFLYFNVK